jgi:hypothetical protein
MEQNLSWENNSFSGSRNFPHLWNPKFRSPGHKILPPVSILRHNNTAHTLIFCWLVTIMLSSRIFLGLPSGHCPSVVTSITLYSVTLCPMAATCSTSLICLDLINWMAIGQGTDHDTLLQLITVSLYMHAAGYAVRLQQQLPSVVLLSCSFIMICFMAMDCLWQSFMPGVRSRSSNDDFSVGNRVKT